MSKRISRMKNPNFSRREIRILLELVKKHEHIIESKKSSKILWGKKTQVWIEIAEMFNSFSGTTYRDAGVLKKKYENLKIIKRECNLEDTGRDDVSLVTKIDEEVKDLIEIHEDGIKTVPINSVVPEDPQIKSEVKESNKREDSDSNRSRHGISTANDKSFGFKDKNKGSSLSSIPGKSEVSAQLMEVAIGKWMHLSEAKSELVQLKKDILRKEHEIKEKFALEQHEVIMKKLKLEAEILKRQLQSFNSKN